MNWVTACNWSKTAEIKQKFGTMVTRWEWANVLRLWVSYRWGKLTNQDK